MTRSHILLVSLLVLVAIPAAAQTAQAVVSRDFAVFAAGANPATATPVVPLTNVPNAQITCGLVKATVPATVQNPSDVYFDDPADASKDCQLQASVASAIVGNAAIPDGTGYRVAARARGATTVSLWSVVSNPFDRVAVPPAAVTGVRVR